MYSNNLHDAHCTAKVKLMKQGETLQIRSKQFQNVSSYEPLQTLLARSTERKM